MMPGDTNFHLHLRFETFHDISVSRVRSGDVEGGLTTLATAMSEISKMMFLYENGLEDTTREEKLRRLASTLAKFGFFDLGMRLARAIGKPQLRQEALASIAKFIAPLDGNAANALVDEAMKLDEPSLIAALELVEAKYIEPGLWIFNCPGTRSCQGSEGKRSHSKQVTQLLSSCKGLPPTAIVR
jgi:hypothetical protein